jgi:SAM-dependent methyltransferase
MEKALSFPIKAENLENINHCPSCNSINLSIISQVSDANGLVFFQTNFCEDCSFVFRAIRPNKNWFSNAFSIRENYQKSRNYSAINPKIEEERYARYFRLGEKIKSTLNLQNKENPSILDIGCGTGSGLVAFNKIGFKSFGLDEDNTRAAFGIDKGLEIFVQSWETFTPDSKFDIITCLHSIEHFHNPSELMTKIKTWLNPGGKVVIEVPNFKYFVIDWTDSLYLAHMANYTPINLVKLAKNCGLKFVSRIHHYLTENKNNENLCMVFETCDSEIIIDDSMIGIEDELNFESVIEKYGCGLPKTQNKNQIISFDVPLINDISLCYKNSDRVSENLSENLHMRTISLNRNNFSIN